MPKLLRQVLKEKELISAFNALTLSRKKDILKYFSFITKDETMMKNANKLIGQLKTKVRTSVFLKS